MSFDTSELDAQCMDPDFSDEAVWVNKPTGPTPLTVIFGISPDYEEDGGVRYKVGDKISAGTLENNTKGMRRKQAILEIKSQQYLVVGFEPDGSGWVEILLEKQ